ncbi:MAG: cell division protein FtsA [Parabacteroides sp.]|nr:cell division protein FtsA [Parabacteroides sp.]
MGYTDFIAAIDLGTSRMVGMVGKKNEQGVLSIIAYEVENSATCIRRGCVYNVEETANKIKRLIRKLENKLQGIAIGKVYVGVGGQSIRTIEHTVPKVLGADGVVTEDVIKSLYEECCNYRPDMLDVLAAVSPVYYLDDRPELNPVGVPCSRIEARYKLIVGRPSLRRNIYKSIAERAQVEIAGVIVSPLALAYAVLSEDERDLGCALIGFGAGVTTLTVFKNNQLKNITVIPFGSNLITKDILSLHLVEPEAERLKITYGSAVMDPDSEQVVQINSADGLGIRDLKLSDLNNIVEARIDEILENVYARLDELGLNNSLGAGVIITGGGAALKNLQEVIRQRLNLPVRYGATRKSLLEPREPLAGNPEYAVAIGLLLQGNKNCAAPAPVKEPVPEPETKTPEVDPEPVKLSKKKKNGGIFGGWGKRIDDMTKSLFDDEETR